MTKDDAGWMRLDWTNDGAGLKGDGIPLKRLTAGIPDDDVRFDLRNAKGSVLVGCRFLSYGTYESHTDSFGWPDGGSGEVTHYAVTNDGWAVNYNLKENRGVLKVRDRRPDVRLSELSSEKSHQIFSGILGPIASATAPLEKRIKEIEELRKPLLEKAYDFEQKGRDVGRAMRGLELEKEEIERKIRQLDDENESARSEEVALKKRLSSIDAKWKNADKACKDFYAQKAAIGEEDRPLGSEKYDLDRKVEAIKNPRNP